MAEANAGRRADRCHRPTAGGTLLLTVRNTGVGLAQAGSVTEGARFGIRLVREWLAALYGGQRRCRWQSLPMSTAALWSAVMRSPVHSATSRAS